MLDGDKKTYFALLYQELIAPLTFLTALYVLKLLKIGTVYPALPYLRLLPFLIKRVVLVGKCMYMYGCNTTKWQIVSKLIFLVYNLSTYK